MTQVRKSVRRYAMGLLPLAMLPFLLGATSDDDSVSDSSTRLSVTGMGYDTQPVTYLRVSAGVESFATDASDAMANNASKLQRLRGALAGNGVKPEDFRTSNLSLSPSTNRDNDDPVKGYQVQHMITIILRDPAKAGDVIDALVDAGVTNLNGPSSYWDATPAAAARARTAAIKDAMTRADVYAKALGMKVKRIVTINDNSGFASREPRGMMAIDARSGTQVDPGQEHVTVAIGATFELSRS